MNLAGGAEAYPRVLLVGPSLSGGVPRTGFGAPLKIFLAAGLRSPFSRAMGASLFRPLCPFSIWDGGARSLIQPWSCASGAF
jgi:hypothetical protein